MAYEALYSFTDHLAAAWMQEPGVKLVRCDVSVILRTAHQFHLRYSTPEYADSEAWVMSSSFDKMWA